MVYSAVPLGTSLMCFRFLQVLFSFIKTGELPHHDHGHVDGLEEEVRMPVDFDPYAMKDNLHPDETPDQKGGAK
jgi:C4-dicarboxylate transporter DctQ subunit